MADYLGHEEGVAIGLDREVGGQLHRTGPPSAPVQRSMSWTMSVLRRASQIDPRDGRDATEGGQRLPHRVVSLQLVASEGAHDEEAGRVRDGRQAPEQRGRAGIGPVEIVEEQDDGRVLAQAGQQVGDRREQQEALGLDVG